MTKLSPAQRQALLAEVGDGDPSQVRQPNAEKMLRLRARKKLMSVMEKVSGALVLRLRRTSDLMQLSSSGLREAFVQGVSCLGCVALGLAVGLNGRVGAPSSTATSPGIDGARGNVVIAEIVSNERMSQIRHGSIPGSERWNGQKSGRRHKAEQRRKDEHAAPGIEPAVRSAQG